MFAVAITSFVLSIWCSQIHGMLMQRIHQAIQLWTYDKLLMIKANGLDALSLNVSISLNKSEVTLLHC